MVKLILILVSFGVSAVGPVTFFGDGVPEPVKVDICHVPPGNPENAHVISISENAVPAHLEHGDCEEFTVAEDGEHCSCAA